MQCKFFNLYKFLFYFSQTVKNCVINIFLIPKHPFEQEIIHQMTNNTFIILYFG